MNAAPVARLSFADKYAINAMLTLNQTVEASHGLEMKTIYPTTAT